MWRLIWKVTLIGLGLAVVAAVGTLALMWPIERREMEHEWKTHLASIADVRKQAIDAIIERSRTSAELVTDYPSVRFLLTGRNPGIVRYPSVESARAHLSLLLASLVRHKSDRFALLLDARGRVVAASDSASYASTRYQEVATLVLMGDTAVTMLQDVNGESILIAGAPVLESRRPLGAVLIAIGPVAGLERRALERDIPAAQDDAVSFLVPQQDVREILSVPLNRDSLGEFSGSRTPPVIAAVRMLSLAPLAIVVKVDRNSALAGIWRRLRLGAAVIPALFFAICGTTFGYCRFRRTHRVSLARFGLLLEEANDAIFFWGEDYRILEVNRRAAELYRCSRNDLIGRPMASLRPPELQGLANAQAEAALGAGQTFETVHQRRDGSRFPIEASSRRVTVGDERIGLTIIRDITERKEAEAERQRLLRRLQVQMEKMPIACVVADPEGYVLDWNPAAERTFGYTRDETIGRRPFDLILPASAREAVSRAVMSRDYSDGQLRLDQNVTKDGRAILCEWTNVVLRGDDGAVLGVMGMAQDVTAQRQSEERLRLLSRAMEQSPVSIVMTDAQARIVYVNPKFESLTGYSAREVLGQNPRIWKSGAQSPEVYRELWETIKSGRIWHGEMQNRTKDGRIVRELASIAPVTDSSGTITHYLAIKEDLTPRKQLEDELRQAQKMEAIGRLAGGVAHDFNNLLTVILGNCEILLADLPDQSPLRQDLVEIEASGRRAAALTRQLLAFSRRQIIQPEVVEINRVIDGIGKMLRRLLGEDITITLDLAADAGQVLADPGQLEQVLMNLSVNARDAMPQGGRLTITTAQVLVEPGHEARQVKPGRHVRITVTDTGTGIPPAVQAHLFEPFFTTKAAGKGTGLGLSTVYGIVKQSNGSILVDSPPGRGATFTIFLPRSEAPVTRKTAIAARASSGKETILIAEDEASVRAIARRALESRGYQVLEASNGDTALEISEAHEGAIDLLLTDLVMPGMGGQELATRLGVRFPQLRTLYTSGYSETAAMNGGALAPDVSFIPKPFSMEEIATKVRGVLDRADG